MVWLDRLAAEILAPLAVWVFASSLDDLVLDASYLFLRCRQRFWGRREKPASPPTPFREANPTIAVLIPCWAEQDVIEKMLEHNLARIGDENFEVWLGVYPNDLATQAKAAACSSRFSRVHYVVCPQDGPTTKADCLNCIYHGLLEEEVRTGKCYEIILQHDAEDVIHPRSLAVIRQYCLRYHMVQIPVFPLPTPLLHATHGTYCDFFAEGHWKDQWVRWKLGGFVPSAGVGTAYRRDALDRVSTARGGLLFDRASLTEDYTIGLQLHRLGCSQVFIEPTLACWGLGSREPDARRQDAGILATRAFFPRGLCSAVRQRARWVTGIALQSWQKFGWQAGRGQAYWLWRDRKGLLSHPVSVIANLVFGYGLLRWAWCSYQGTHWEMSAQIVSRPWLLWLLGINAAVLIWRLAMVAFCSAKVYGWRQAATVPLRAPWANLINCCATFRALATFAAARTRGREVGWEKTCHAYPDPRQRSIAQPRLGEILVSHGAVTQGQLRDALKAQGLGERLGERLLRTRLVSEQSLYQALSRQRRLPLLEIRGGDVDPQALRTIPRALRERLRLVPFRLESNSLLWLAGPEPPTETFSKTLTRFRRLDTRFALITPSNYEQLQRGLAQRPAPRDPTRANLHFYATQPPSATVYQGS